MATAIFVNIMTPLPSDSQHSRPDLRRATYIHISDLTSAYNIDHARLEQELGRVKVESEAASTTVGTENEDDPSGSSTSDLDSTATPLPQKRLQPPRGGYNLCVLVGKVNVVVDKRRVDQSRVRLAEVEIGDETGTVSLRARDEQIDVLEDVSKRSGAVVLRNCTLELYQGKHIRLAVTKWGKLSTYPDNVASTPPIPSKMNFDRNFSLIDLSLVASEMVGSHSNPLYTSRPANQAESSDAQGARTGQAKSGGPTHRQHQQLQQTQAPNRRGTRGGDRRQTRGKQAPSGGSPARGHYGGSPEGGAQPLPGQIRYQGMHGYSGYDQAMGVRQYPYPQIQHQEVLSQASPQQQMLLLQQQYEMQQRQLHHNMYLHGQQERNRPNIGQSRQMQPSTMLPPTIVGSASFESHGDYTVSSYATGGSEQHPSGLNVGPCPPLIPMSMSGGPAPAEVSSGATANQDQQQMARHQEGSYASAVQREGRYHQMGAHPSLPAGSESPLGKMNPQATAFAPSYMNPSANSQATHQMYFPFDPSQGTGANLYRRPTSQQPATYASAMMYAPAGGAAKPAQGSQEPSSAASTAGPSDVTTNSQASGKENVQSIP